MSGFLVYKNFECKTRIKTSFPDALNGYSAINMPGVPSTDAPAQKDVKGIEIVNQFRFYQDYFFLNAFDIQAVWRGILLHRGNMPQ